MDPAGDLGGGLWLAQFIWAELGGGLKVDPGGCVDVVDLVSIFCIRDGGNGDGIRRGAGEKGSKGAREQRGVTFFCSVFCPRKDVFDLVNREGL